MIKPLDLQSYTFQLANGESRTFSMLDFFAVTAGSGVKVKLKGQGRFVGLDLYNVIGDDISGIIGPVDFTNDTGSTITVTAFTSTRRFNPTALSNTATVNAIVSGGAANGAPVVGNPTLIAGWDGTNARTVLTDTAGKLRTAPEASATGGATRLRRKSTADTNDALVKGAAGRVFGWTATNTTAAAKHVKLYDKATAPVVGTDVPAVTFTIPANATVSHDMALGEAYALGIGLGITGAVGDTDTTAVAAGDVLLTLRYG